MKPNLGLSDKNRKGSVEVLSRMLADEYVLYTKLRNYHWNVTGSDFSELHKLFESQYEEVDEIIDDTAERARSLGGNALGTLKEFLQQTGLKEAPGDYPAAKVMIKNLLLDHEALIRSLRDGLAVCADKYQDMGTSDFITGVMEQHEKMAWMLRAYLE